MPQVQLMNTNFRHSTTYSGHICQAHGNVSANSGIRFGQTNDLIYTAAFHTASSLNNFNLTSSMNLSSHYEQCIIFHDLSDPDDSERIAPTRSLHIRYRRSQPSRFLRKTLSEACDMQQPAQQAG
jgi:hypothetical protein